MNEPTDANGLTTGDVKEIKTILRQLRIVKDDANDDLHVSFLLNKLIFSDLKVRFYRIKILEYIANYINKSLVNYCQLR